MQPETLNRSIQPTPTVHPRGFTPTCVTFSTGVDNQATHTLVVDSPAVVPELGLHPRLAVRLSAEAVDLTHPTQQLLVIDRPRRG